MALKNIPIGIERDDFYKFDIGRIVTYEWKQPPIYLRSQNLKVKY